MDEYLKLLGKQVKVIIDRPLYSKHPDYHFSYLLNYGYIPFTKAEDGEEIDVYLLGVTRPVREFTGVVQAVIKRKDDLENKLVVTPTNYSVSEEEILARTHFQEKFFAIEIVMLNSSA